MKSRLILFSILFAAVFVGAYTLETFRGWDKLEEESSEIAVVRCAGSGKLLGPMINGPRSASSARVLYHLKGTNDVANLWTNHTLHGDENYLVFGYCNNGTLVAYEEFKVIPLGNLFSTNWVAGKTLDDHRKSRRKIRASKITYHDTGTFHIKSSG